MKTGRRVANPNLKKLAGTFRDDRHGAIVELVTPPRNVPVAPGYMTKEARIVWDEDFDRVVACGAVEADSGCFATYCALEAACRPILMSGELPKAAYLVELRRLRELLGIAGHRSRLGKATAQDGAARSSPFSTAPKAA